MLTAVMVPYGNEGTARTRLRRDLLPALQQLRVDTEIIVVDNSPTRLDGLAEDLSGCGYPSLYCWPGGRNLWYGPALNEAVALASHPYLLYVCATHGEARDPSWAADLLAPLLDKPEVAMTGSLRASGSPANLGFPAGLPELHIQGGVFAARRAALAAHPYPDGDCAHWGSDIHVCFQLMVAGWDLVDVPTVCSVWREEPGPGPYKYVHPG